MEQPAHYDNKRSRRSKLQQGLAEGEIITGIDTVTVTVERPPPFGLERRLTNPGLPRANQAVSAERQDGTLAAPSTRTVLQQHCDFWDRDADNKIYPTDTYTGFRRLGFNPLFSTAAAVVINGALSLPSQNTWFIDPFLPICTQHIHRDKHGSDTQTFDKEGRYVPEKFEEIFSKFGKDGTLTLGQVWCMTEANRDVMDPFGWTAQKLEWLTLWWLAADQDGKLGKETIRSMYDGTLFWNIAAEREANAKAAVQQKELSQATRRAQRSADRSQESKNE